MSSAGNFLWILFGGLLTGLLWVLAGVVMYVTILGIPWGRACFTFSNLAFLPFGREAVRIEVRRGRHGERGSAARALGNILWFVFGGWYLALSHVFAGILCCLSVVGIPFGLQHFKLGGLAIAPLGRRIVSVEEARILRTEAAHASIARARQPA